MLMCYGVGGQTNRRVKNSWRVLGCILAGKEICVVVFTPEPYYSEYFPADAVAYPVIAHVDRLGSAQLNRGVSLAIPTAVLLSA